MSKFILYFLPLGLVAACAGEPQPEPVMTPAGRTVEPSWNDRVSVAQLANAYCDHEQRCGKIGADKVYPTRIACEEAWFDSGFARLRLTPCRRGIDHGRLAVCLDDIRTKSCDKLTMEMSPVGGCQATDLCAM